MNEPTILDEAALARLEKLGGEKFLRQMLELFVEYAPKRLAAARAGEQAPDLNALANAVHPLRSSAGQIGAVHVAELAGQIESLAQAGQAAALPPLLAEIESAVERVKSYLEQKLKEPAP